MFEKQHDASPLADGLKGRHLLYAMQEKDSAGILVKSMPALVLWSRRGLNPRPNGELTCFLHA